MERRRKHTSRACDQCSRRKIRCLGGPETVCPTCDKLGKKCTWENEHRPRGPKRGGSTAAAGAAGAPVPLLLSSATEQEALAAAVVDTLPALGSMLSSASSSSDPSSLLPPGSSSAGGEPHFSQSAEHETFLAASAWLDASDLTSLWPEVSASQAALPWLDSFDWLFSAPPSRQPSVPHDPPPVGTESVAELPSVPTPRAATAPSPGFEAYIDDVKLGEYVQAFFDNAEHHLPILDQDVVERRIADGDHHVERHFRALVFGMAAVCEIISAMGKPESARREDILAVKGYVADAALCCTIAGPSSQFSVDDIATSVLLNYVYLTLGDLQTSWFYLQQALSIAQVLQLDQAGAKDTGARLKAYCILTIIERAQAVTPTTNQRHSQILRLPGNIWELTRHRRESLPADELAGFPFHHLRLFSLVDREIVACWRGGCARSGVMCSRWTVESAVALQQTLSREFEVALAQEHDRENVNLVITAAWLRDRFWNICRTHGLVTQHGHEHAELSLDLLLDNLARTSAFCASVPAANFDPIFDWVVKVCDIVMTAITVLKSRQAWAALPNHAMRAGALQVSYLPYIHRFIGMLVTCRREDYVSELVKALGEVV
ncbi:Glucose transport transcription regulator RGT1 [Vanrija pseudolonga]|uniref:Glucose transport transcription regulator RGT1 n=1 Tax=Vanrija pseudolonga TaxID=143232 RepID=A0AAF0YHF8_9TREE|nr:Glucose transport transcription regulator RGT1 [Vanrija pseudolonga]